MAATALATKGKADMGRIVESRFQKVYNWTLAGMVWLLAFLVVVFCILGSLAALRILAIL